MLSLTLLGAPLPEADPAVVSTGDRVRVELEPEVFQAMQEGRNSWNDVMLSVSPHSIDIMYILVYYTYVMKHLNNGQIFLYGEVVLSSVVLV